MTKSFKSRFKPRKKTSQNKTKQNIPKIFLNVNLNEKKIIYIYIYIRDSPYSRKP